VRRIIILVVICTFFGSFVPDVSAASTIEQRVQARLERRKNAREAERKRRQLLRQRRIALLNLQQRRRVQVTVVPAAPEVPSASSEEQRTVVLELVNRERERHGAAPLTYNPLLEKSAQAYAEEMVRLNFFGHDPPSGETFKQRIQKTGYGDLSIETCNCRRYVTVFGENLAKNYPTPESVMNGWMNSPDHRDNILKPQFKELGVGIVALGPGGSMWVQHFGSITIEPK
jgi:uncharacterized protein YkwD